MSQPEKFIHFCVTSGRAIFLDLQRNRYFALTQKTNDAFITIVGERKFGAIPKDILDEIGKGTMPGDLRIDGSTTCNKRAIINPESDRLWFQDEAPASTSLVLLAWIALVVAIMMVRFCPLYVTLGVLGKGADKTNLNLSDDRATDRIGAAFRKANLFIRSDGNCLPITLASIWMCRRFGHRPTLVIGVRVNPFSAHCWSQDGPVVLNDSVERVLPYQPIFVL